MKGVIDMLQIKFLKDHTNHRKIVIREDVEDERALIRKKMIQSIPIENPAKTFAETMKSGGFEGMPEYEVEKIAVYADAISDAWRKDIHDPSSHIASMDIGEVLVRLLQLYANKVIH